MTPNLFAVLALTVGVLAMPMTAQSAEITFNPNDPARGYDVDGNGVLRLWGVPEASGNALVADPDYGWPTTMAVSAWYSVVLKSQEMNLSVVVGYDPNNFEIWYIAKPR